MPRYRFNHAYRTQTLGPWEKDDQVELEEAVAEFIGRDSPGAISSLDVLPAPGEPDEEETGARDVSRPPADRMQRRGRTRGGGG